MATRAEITAVMALLNENYPDTKMAIGKSLLDIWEQILEPYSFDLLKAATIMCIAECTFMPKVADVVKRVKDLIALSQPTAADAWGMVQKVIAEFDNYEPAKSQAKIEAMPLVVRRTVGQIGYGFICDGKPDVIRAQFMRVYDTELNRQAEIALLPAACAEVVRGLQRGDNPQRLGAGPANIGEILTALPVGRKEEEG